MEIVRRIARALAWGSVAGLAALVLDQLLAVLTLGFGVPVAPRFAAAYAAAGALAAGLVEGCLLALRRRPWRAAQTLAAAAPWGPRRGSTTPSPPPPGRPLPSPPS